MSAVMSQEMRLPWHESLWRQIAQAQRSGRVAHGLLVCGAPGVGKRLFAARLANALLCRAPTATSDACGVCAGCRQWAAQTHPDVSRLVPDEPGRQIRVDQVRAFTRSLHLTAQYDTGRVGWIEPAEQLNTAAANSLLKTLEEPALDAHLILISDHADALMATIRSRCQIVRVPPAPVAVAREWLSERGIVATGDDPDALRTPLRVVAHGQRDYDTLAAEWHREMAQLLAGRADAVQLAEIWAKQPPDLLLDWLYRIACRLVQHRLSGDPLHDNALAQAASGLDSMALQRFCAGVSRASRLAETNADWQLVVESLLLELSVSESQGRIR